MTKSFTGAEVRLTHLHGCEVEWTNGPKGWQMQARPGTDFTMGVDIVLIAMGFLHVTHSGLVEDLGLRLDDRGNIAVEDFMTSEPGIFAAGDATLGASLVVRAIYAGREAAAAMNRWLLQ
jgi:glutamate synthase (NADPH/NADH) small chain